MCLLRDELANCWRLLVSKYCRDEHIISSLLEEVINRYSEAYRYYHNLRHVHSLLGLFRHYKGAIRKKDVVLFSIYYHDIIYIPGRDDNEYQSALVAEAALQKLGVGQENITGVQLYINATKTHAVQPAAANDLKFFLDFDMAILASDPKEYSEYSTNIRKEFGYLSDAVFAMGRKAFLQTLLQQPYLFYTAEFRSKEPQARENIRWEIECLRHI